jgi:trk system potassium uptake protein
VLAIDVDEGSVQAIRDDVQQAVITDVRSLDALQSVVTKDIDEAVVSLGESLEASILCTLHLRTIGVQRIRAKASSDDHAAILRAVGATDVIFPERETAERMAQRILHPDLLDYLPLSPEFQVVEISTPASFAGKTLADLHLRKNWRVLVVAVKTAKPERTEFLPAGDLVLPAGSTLVIIGKAVDTARLIETD